MIDEEIKVRPCVRSGLCCKTGPCAFGEWDYEHHQCKFLETEIKGNGYEFYKCGIYEKIIGVPGSEINPAFGAGCCMSLFNTARDNNIRAIVDGRADMPRGSGTSIPE